MSKNKNNMNSNPSNPQDTKQTNQKSEDELLTEIFEHLESKGLITKECIYMRQRVEYVRGKDLQEYFQKESAYLCEKLQEYFDVKVNPEKKSLVEDLYLAFHNLGVFKKATRHKDDSNKLKYPKRLVPLEEVPRGENLSENDSEYEKDHNPTLFQKNQFYVVYIVRTQKKTYFWLSIAILAVLGICMFPIWPLEVKLGLWWVSLILLIFMVILIYLAWFAQLEARDIRGVLYIWKRRLVVPESP